MVTPLRCSGVGAAAFLLLLLAGCDAVAPDRDPLVVQAFAETGRPLPPLLVRRAGAIGGGPAGTPVAGADVLVRLDGELVPYRADGADGRYVPVTPTAAVPAGARLAVEVREGGDVAAAQSVLPVAVVLDSVRVLPADAPVEAVFADSLGLDLREGYLYPVTVRAYWRAAGGADSLRWARLQLRPPAAFPSAVVDFLLRTDETTHEDSLGAPAGAPGARVWTGVYAVPVDGPDDVLPAHRVRVALVRSGPDYARYARSREDPDSREPIGNVRGGLGIAAGIALDTLTLEVGP